jgi:hypothetical protein
LEELRSLGESLQAQAIETFAVSIEEQQQQQLSMLRDEACEDEQRSLYARPAPRHS